MNKIHYTQLPPSQPGSPIATEWDTYRREASRLLNEGHEGKWVLIKGTEIIGIWPTDEEAAREKYSRYLLEPALVHQIQEWETVIRGPLALRLCPSLFFPSRRAS
jgi:hypothetical protein